MTADKIEQIMADGTTVSVDETDFKIEPLTVEQFLKAQVIGQNQDEGQALLHMMAESLDEEGIGKQDIKEAPAKLLKPLQEAVMEVNDFEDFFDEDEKQEALSKLQ